MFNRFMRLDLKEAPKDVYLWTLISGVLYSGSTFILSVIATQCISSYAGGIYTIALTIGNQLITVGYFNTRTYQASDISEKTKFDDYFTLKIYTTIAMIFIGIIWVIAANYNLEKSLSILIVTIFKCIEVFGDVFEGRYQQKGRFDISSKSLLLRTATFIVAFTATAFITHNLLLSLVVMTVAYFLCFVFVDVHLIHYFGGVHVSKNLDKQIELVRACFPLFVNSFLLMYINNSPKYSIDAYQDEEVLVRFNALFMIAFVINMFSSVILKPVINQLSIDYSKRNMKAIYRALARQCVVILGLTAVCVIGCYLLGTQVLSLVYGFDLTSYKVELCIMVIGGSFTALYQVFQNIIIVMRHQYVCLVGCIITTLVTLVESPLLVSKYSIMGGAVGYVISMSLMALIYGFFMIWIFKKEGRVEND